MEIVKKIDTNGDSLLSTGVCLSLGGVGRYRAERTGRAQACCVLSTEEVTLWIQHVYRKYAVDDAKERFPEFDTNSDGVVTWEEYNTVAHDQLTGFDDAVVPEDPEQESLRHVGTHLLFC